MNSGLNGIVYTFYSYKGGVGRSMALANVAALLAKGGHKVLVVDWDLEAPGLEKFFAKAQPDVIAQRATTPGIVDLILASEPIDWRNCVIRVGVGSNGARVSLITAGQSGADYTARLHRIDFDSLFREKNLGRYIESLREQWIAEYDFVLVDSRTGVTDIGGICTVQLADVLVLLFTTTDSSVEGIKQIVERAREQQQRLPVDRQTLIAVPVPARDESRTEYERSAKWKQRFAEEFAELYADWLPNGITARDAVDILRIPYVPYWSFGETLPVIEEGTKDPASIGHAYELLARLLQHKLDWSAAIGDDSDSLVPPRSRNGLDLAWIEAKRHDAAMFMGTRTLRIELVHGCLSSIGRSSNAGLRPSITRMFPHLEAELLQRFPTLGEVLPIPTSEGIVTKDLQTHYRSYSVTRVNGDYYGAETFREDWDGGNGPQPFDGRLAIRRVASAILRSARLYELMSAPRNAEVELRLGWFGLLDRVLRNADAKDSDPVHVNRGETQIEISMTYSLDSLPAKLTDHVKTLCAPLFELFDFAVVPDSVYNEVVAEILALDAEKQ